MHADELHLPDVWFSSGDRCKLLMTVPFDKDGSPHVRVYMVPLDYVCLKYDIDRETLPKHIHEKGHIVREYPKEFMQQLSNHPQQPVIEFRCRMDGSLDWEDRLARWEKKVGDLKKELNAERHEVINLRRKLRHAMQTGGEI